MQFILTGFTQDRGFRVFGFEGIGPDRTRTPFTVRTDLALVRRYGIRVQELPLLCRGLLEQRDETERGRAVTFTEAEMRRYADNAAAEREAALRKRRSTHKPSPANVVRTGWKGTLQA